MSIVGSPPRAWGQLPTPARRNRSVRFTPTGVGTINCTTRLSDVYPVHPHGRGDNWCGEQSATKSTGSPPRAWGQYGLLPSCAAAQRFTPTGVGTIRKRVHAARRAAVHPHGRGDNVRRRRWASSARGSPPRAWGQFRLRNAGVKPLRFTPTGVGTIGAATNAIPSPPVHPHGRGDNNARLPRCVAAVGSPPRAWGQ